MNCGQNGRKAKVIKPHLLLFLTPTVYNWTSEEVVEWLVGVVDLPELVTLFRELEINGKQLPL